MIGLEKLSTIKAKLRQAFAAGGYNPIVDLDREIDELKISKSADAGELESLETFRRARRRLSMTNRHNLPDSATSSEPARVPKRKESL